VAAPGPGPRRGHHHVRARLRPRDPATQGVEAKGAAPTGVGYSAVVSPFGEVLEALEGEPGLIFADLDPAEVDDARQKLPVLANRREF
jgi:predicted amidohydrolase